MIFRLSIAVIFAALLSSLAVPASAVPGATIEQENDTLNINLSRELVEIMHKDPGLHQGKVLDAFTALNKNTGGTRSLKSKNGKSLKSARSAVGLSDECRQDELTFYALCEYLYLNIAFVGGFFDGPGGFLNSTYCDITDSEVTCDMNRVEEDFLFVNSTECVNDFGGQVLNTTTSYDLLYPNVTLSLKHLPFCIPTSCDPKEFTEFATDMSSMKLTKSVKSSVRRTNRRNLQGCFFR